MQPGVQFRRARSSDGEAMLSVKREAILDLDEGYDERQRRAWAPDSGDRNAFAASPLADRYVVRVVLVDGDLVAYGVLNRPKERLDALFVHPEHQRQNLATILVRQLETSARFSAIESLTVVSAVTAAGFYEALGYERVEHREKEINGLRLPFVTMWTDLTTEKP